MHSLHLKQPDFTVIWFVENHRWVHLNGEKNKAREKKKTVKENQMKENQLHG